MDHISSFHGDPFQAHSRKIQFDATMWQLIRNGRKPDSAHLENSAILCHVCCSNRSNEETIKRVLLDMKFDAS